MDTATLIALSVALAMDAFAVSVARSSAARCVCRRYALRMAFAFGGFQFFMPVLGWLLGLGFRRLIDGYDHWLAFGLLTFIGGKMLWEAREFKRLAHGYTCRHHGELLLLAVATSIDALAVGLSLSLLGTAILYPALVIGLITFTICLLGVYIGVKIGHLFERSLEVLGGLTLIAIGVKILGEHLGWW